MKVCVISPFYVEDYNISRPSFVRHILLKNGHDVITLTSDFSHQKKEKVSYSQNNVFTVKTLKYSSNTSIVRFVSHAITAILLAYKAITLRKDVDVYYVTAPFAITAFLIKLVTRKKLIIDIIDFWPNSLPFRESFFSKHLLKLWSKVNAMCCRFSDTVISLSSEFLRNSCSDSIEKISFGAESNFDHGPVIRSQEKTSQLTILYIGNIGSLYDFQTLLHALNATHKTIKLHIIGEGDRKQWLLQELDAKKIDFVFHGMVYDKVAIKRICSECDIGFNGYISTNASFSYKALSYFSYGLPILNSMKGDLYEVVEKNGVGFNYVGGDFDSLLESINSMVINVETFEKVKRYFESELDFSVIEGKLLEKIESIYDSKS